MISAFFIYNQKGEVLISRLYRQDLKRSVADIFRIQVISNTDVRSPIITLGSTSFFHVRHENLYIVAVTKCNANAALIFEFCYRLINIGKSYFGKLDEEAVKNNFVLIYELLDEILDFGYPQNSETETLKLYITTEGVRSERALKTDSSKITNQATGATSWRRSDIKYRKNEAFIDVIESVNLLMSTKGTILRADVSGQIMMRAYLSGTPECKFGLNDKILLDKDSSQRSRTNAVEIDDFQFHQCVKLGKFDSDRTITFVPPDGEFELMRYRTTENVILPFRVHPVVNEIGKSRVEYRVTVKATFSSKLYANEVVLRIPTPLNTANINIRVVSGKAKYVPAENHIFWRIPRFQGQQEITLSGEAELSATTIKKVWSRPPISMDFQVLMFTSSGLLVRFLKVFEKSNYKSVKWVRYMTKAGSYQIRCDGDFPTCGNCKTYNSDCSYSHPGSKRGYAETIDERLNKIEQVLSKFLEGIFVSSYSTNTDITSSPPTPIYSSSTSSLISKVANDGKDDLRVIATEPPPPSKYNGDTDLPDKYLFDHLIQVFIKNGSSSRSPLIHKPTFLKQIKDKNNQPSLLLLNAVMAVASIYSDNPEVRLDKNKPETAGDLFFRRATSLLDDFMDRSRLSTIQAICLLIQFCVKSSDHSCRLWMLIGMGMKMALDLGLHRDCSQWNISKLEKAMRTRLATLNVFNLFMVTFIITLFRKPYPIYDHNTRYPYEIDEDGDEKQDVINYCHFSKLLKIFGNVLHSKPYTSQPGAIRNTLPAIDASLNSWSLALPAHLQYTPNDKLEDLEPNSVHVYASYLHQFYNTILITLHRPYIDSPEEYPGFDSRKICHNAAINIAKLSSCIPVDSRGIYYTFSASAYCLTQSTMISIMNMDHRGHQDHKDYSESAIKYAKKSVEALKKLARCGRLGKGYCGKAKRRVSKGRVNNNNSKTLENGGGVGSVGDVKDLVIIHGNENHPSLPKYLAVTPFPTSQIYKPNPTPEPSPNFQYQQHLSHQQHHQSRNQNLASTMSSFTSTPSNPSTAFIDLQSHHQQLALNPVSSSLAEPPIVPSSNYYNATATTNG
ncbi:15327_t:CDS:10, partial [Entrophospora sp. SA101]